MIKRYDSVGFGECGTRLVFVELGTGKESKSSVDRVALFEGHL